MRRKGSEPEKTRFAATNAMINVASEVMIDTFSGVLIATGASNLGGLAGGEKGE